MSENPAGNPLNSHLSPFYMRSTEFAKGLKKKSQTVLIPYHPDGIADHLIKVIIKYDIIGTA